MKNTKSRRRRIEVDRAVLLEEAKRLAGDFGWSILPVRNKKPNLKRWSPYQRERPTDKELVDFFDHPDTTGLAAICGAVSECLVVRDFDKPQAFDRWRADYPDAARWLPTSQTGRGYQVFFRSPTVRRIRAIGNGEGELRGKGYVVLPPSLHAKGLLYRWLTAPDKQIPVVEDPAEFGLAPESKTPAGGTQAQPIACVPLTVDEAIAVTQPTGPGQRNRRLFDLARFFRALIPDAEYPELEAIVRGWHKLAFSVIRTKDFRESWKDFKFAWSNVRTTPISLVSVVARADTVPIPQSAKSFKDERIRRLACICASLQEHWGPRPFFLGAREAAKLLGIDKTTAWRWMQVLERRRVLLRVRTGCQAARKATEWRYLGVGDKTLTRHH